jgi:Fic family protein
LKRPGLPLAVYINGAVRGLDKQFDEPDELDRVERALAATDSEDDVVVAAGILAYAVTRAQGFAEGNKRTALLLARWLLDENGMDGLTFLPVDDGSSPTCS